MSDATPTPTPIPANEIHVIKETAYEAAGAPTNGNANGGAGVQMPAPAVVVQQQVAGQPNIPPGAKMLDLSDPIVREAVAAKLEAGGYHDAANKLRGREDKLGALGKVARFGDRDIKMRHVAYVAGGILVLLVVANVVGRYNDQAGKYFRLFRKSSPAALHGKK